MTDKPEPAYCRLKQFILDLLDHNKYDPEELISNVEDIIEDWEREQEDKS